MQQILTFRLKRQHIKEKVDAQINNVLNKNVFGFILIADI